MKPYERRAVGAYPYFKLAVWDERACCWRDGRRTFPTEHAARGSAPPGARCRISRVDDFGRTDLEAFLT